MVGGFAVAAIVLVGLLAGVHLAGIGGLNRALRALPADVYITTKQSMDRELPALAKPLTIAALLAMAGATTTAAASGAAAVAALDGVGLLAGVVALVAVLRGDLPINQLMDTWNPADPPADWQRWRERWEGAFVVRATALLLAFCCVIGAGAVAR
ncbi:MAG TPA: hypothetical protein VGM75_21305 [Pseudonocardiaceae bacterium]